MLIHGGLIMRRFYCAALAAIAVFGFASVASAASPPPVYSWTGFYFGLNIGGARSSFLNLDGPETPHCWWCLNNYGKSANNLILGGQLGYNFQFNNIVVGIEGEVGKGLFKDSVVANDPTYLTPNTHLSDNVFGLGTGRIGYSFGPTMVYAKGGVGFVQVNYQWSDPRYAAWAGNAKTTYGGVYGAGVEYQISPLVSVKLEYMRLAFSDTSILNVQGYCCNYQQQVQISPIDTIKVGVNFLFGASH